MKQLIGVSLILIGVAAGLYTSLWWAFIGGIVQIIEQIKAETIDALTIAIAITKIFFAGPIGYLTALIFTSPASLLINGK